MIIYTDGNEYTQLIERSSLIDWLFLDISSIPNISLPYFENRKTDRSKRNSIFENFRWVNEAIPNSFDFNWAIERFEDIRDLKLYIDEIYLQPITQNNKKHSQILIFIRKELTILWLCRILKLDIKWY